MTANKKWSEEEDKLLEQMVKAKIPPEEMTRVLKTRTLIAIKDRIGSRGLSFHYMPEIDMEAFRKLMGQQPERKPKCV